jgi:hypothetical protein
MSAQESRRNVAVAAIDSEQRVIRTLNQEACMNICPPKLSMRAALAGLSLFSCLMLSAPAAQCIETVTLVRVAKSFQYVIFPIAQERGYMKEKGIDLKIMLSE